MSWILRKKNIVGMLGCLAASWFVLAVNAEDKPGKTETKTTVTKTSDWPVKFTVKHQVAKPTDAQQKYEVKQAFYPALTKREQYIQEALNTITECEFSNIPLSEVLNSLQRRHGVNVFLDTMGLGENGLTTEEPINVALSGITLKSALNIILKPIGLDYVVDNEVLKITTADKVAHTFKMRIYPVADLCDSPEDYKALENVIQNTCLENKSRPSKHYPVDDLVFGGPGKKQVLLKNGSASISVVPQCKAIVINQTDRVHEKIVELLTQLRQVRDDQEGQATKK